MTYIKKSYKYYILGEGCICLFLLFLFFTDSIFLKMKDALNFSYTTLIPSLFPMIIMANILISSNAFMKISKILSPLFSKITGLSECSICVFLLGITCGSPIGAISASSLYEQNKISKDELEYLIVLSSIPSPAFIINTVGSNILKSKKCGIMLYISSVLSCILVSLIYKRIFLKFNANKFSKMSEKKEKIFKILTSSIKSSVLSMLNICGFFIFFSVLCEVIGKLIKNEIMQIFIYGLLEISCGVRAAANLPYILSGAFCAFIIGWSGLSVIFQVISNVKCEKFNNTRFICAKLCEGIISAGIFLVISNF